MWIRNSLYLLYCLIFPNHCCDSNLRQEDIIKWYLRGWPWIKRWRIWSWFCYLPALWPLESYLILNLNKSQFSYLLKKDPGSFLPRFKGRFSEWIQSTWKMYSSYEVLFGVTHFHARSARNPSCPPLCFGDLTSLNYISRSFIAL